MGGTSDFEFGPWARCAGSVPHSEPPNLVRDLQPDIDLARSKTPTFSGKASEFSTPGKKISPRGEAKI